MLISRQQIAELQQILNEQNVTYEDANLQAIGVAIARFVMLKELGKIEQVLTQ